MRPNAERQAGKSREEGRMVMQAAAAPAAAKSRARAAARRRGAQQRWLVGCMAHIRGMPPSGFNSVKSVRVADAAAPTVADDWTAWISSIGGQGCRSLPVAVGWRLGLLDGECSRRRPSFAISRIRYFASVPSPIHASLTDAHHRPRLGTTRNRASRYPSSGSGGARQARRGVSDVRRTASINPPIASNTHQRRAREGRDSGIKH